ncbi:MAG TPA: phosphatase PAP2-related protein [Candidatus Dormibacteraeota bacterium]|nr:phosphatase PAP2-related protein [Candidatus Dormibacteraeota bacterium]
MKPGENSARWRILLVRVVVTGVILAIWFWTQSLLGARMAPASGVGDVLHNLTAGLNSYFAQDSTAQNTLLILSSAFIDALALFLLGSWLFGGSIRPFLGLVLLMLLRQLLEALCSLPAPRGMLWHDTGFPSLLVTYHVANDFFFSGHTAIAVFGALELSRFQRKWLTGVAILLVFFEIATVLVLRAHYTMDVFTGFLAALWVARISERFSTALDRRFRAIP